MLCMRKYLLNESILYNLDLYIRTFANFFFKLLDLKRMQVFPLLKIQYQKVLCDFIKKKSAIAYEFRMMSNPTIQST